MAETSSGLECLYHLREDGIHEFTFRTSSKVAIDQFFQQLERILSETPHTETLRYLVDVTGGDRQVSLVTMAQRFRRLEAQLPHRARGRTAILHRSGAPLSFIDGFIRALAPSRDVTRFFPIQEREAAVAWLLSE